METQHIKMDEIWMPQIVDGRKINTIRLGKKDIIPGPLVIYSDVPGIKNITVECTEVCIKKFCDVNKIDVLGGFHRCLSECKSVLRKYYCEIEDNDIITIVWFKYEEKHGKDSI